MKIAILTLGTRGDVEPYAVLGEALQRRGHEVTLSTAKNFEKLVRGYGIDFAPVEADFQEVLNSEEGKKMMKGNPLAIRRNLNTWVYPLITSSLTQFYLLAKNSDVVVYHVKTLADSFADQFPEKMIRASVLPIVEPTSEFANPAFSGIPLPKLFNRLSYAFSSLSMKLLAKPIGRFRAGLGLSSKFKLMAVKNIYGISPSFLPTPHDYPPASRFTGFWLGASKEALSDDLMEFIQAGDPPLLITFGSMPFQSKFNLEAALLRIILELKTRIVLVKGWGITEGDALKANPNIKVIASAPYDKLFPLTRAVVHHGGIGTTAACIQAGKPFFICPVLYPVGDQLFWGKHAHEQGIAVRPIPLQKMTEADFVASVAKLLNNAQLYENAKRLQQHVFAENGLAAAASAVEDIAKVRVN